LIERERMKEKESHERSRLAKFEPIHDDKPLLLIGTYLSFMVIEVSYGYVFMRIVVSIRFIMVTGYQGLDLFFPARSFVRVTPVQKYALPLICAGYDLMVPYLTLKILQESY
jgi:hypothetical protein